MAMVAAKKKAASLRPGSSSNSRDHSASDSRSRVVEQQRQRERIEAVRAPVTVTTPRKAARLAKLLRERGGNSTETQRMRLLRALRLIGPLTTHEIRQYLDIVQPNTRVFELRALGYRIETRWVQQETAAGRLHHFAEYVVAA